MRRRQRGSRLRRIRRIAAGILAAIAAAAAVEVAPAAGGEFAPPPLELRFANPGARSTGFGGAFVALADDATAAFSNPAGLVGLSRMEVSVELRGELDLSAATTGSDLVRSNATTVGFASFVYPFKRVSLAFYLHDLADLTLRTSSSGAPFGGGVDVLAGTTDLEAGVRGLAAAFRVNDDLSLGLGLVFYGTSLAAVFEEVTIGGDAPGGEVRRLASLEGEKDDLRLAAGLLWRFAPSLTLGAFYRQGPRLGVDFRGSVLDAAGGGETLEAEDTPIAFPDTSGVGIAWRTLADRLTLSCEWNHLTSSRLLTSLDPRVFDTASWRLDDGDELHLGAEYVFLRPTPVVALRLGAWHEEPPLLRRLGAAGRPIARGDGGIEHASGGVGIAFRRYQVDLGLDHSEAGDLLSLAFVYSF